MKERNEKSIYDTMNHIKDEVSIFKIYRLMNKVEDNEIELNGKIDVLQAQLKEAMSVINE